MRRFIINGSYHNPGTILRPGVAAEFVIMNDQSILIGTQEVWGTNAPFGISLPDLRQHIYVIGKTGSGKTTMLRNMIIQHIAIRLLSADDLQATNMREPFQWNVDIGQRRKVGVIPDRVFGLECDRKATWYCLEADRGTMPITRGHLDQTSFQRKLLAYAATWSQSLHRTRFGWQRFRVLTVTTSAQRVQGIKQACQELANGHGLFLFLDAAAMAQQRDILTIPWQTSRPDKTETLT